MKLTGKCKADFEEWLSEYYDIDIARFGNDRLTLSKIVLWEETPLPMQYGVLVDFFDSVDINLDNKFENEVHRLLNTFQKGDVRNFRNEARTAAIEKANEIYNSNELQN